MNRRAEILAMPAGRQMDRAIERMLDASVLNWPLERGNYSTVYESADKLRIRVVVYGRAEEQRFKDILLYLAQCKNKDVEWPAAWNWLKAADIARAWLIWRTELRDGGPVSSNET